MLRPRMLDQLRQVLRVGALLTRQSHLLTRNARLQVVDHVPKAVDLSTLDDLERLQAVERVVRGVEPLGDRLRLYQFGQPSPGKPPAFPALLCNPGSSGLPPPSTSRSPAPSSR